MFRSLYGNCASISKKEREREREREVTLHLLVVLLSDGFLGILKFYAFLRESSLYLLMST